jgi:hypothetical protein
VPVVETLDDQFVDLDRADVQVPPQQLAADRAHHASVLIALGVLQVAWIAVLLYIAFVVAHV